MSLSSLYDLFWEKLKSDADLAQFEPQLRALTQAKVENPIQGDYPRWKSHLDQLPKIADVDVDFSGKAVDCRAEIDEATKKQVRQAYQGLIPWRKGPFEMFDCFIDSEWQSWMKWNRIEAKLPNLWSQKVLDVGCGNGYYLFKMAQHKPKILLGVDPGLLQIIQFWSIEKYAQSGAAILPLGIQNMPSNMQAFDVVFSMGVFYHRKNPIQHIIQLNELLKSKGELILETLVVEGDEKTCLLPQGRYAQMRNVWFLPSVDMLKTMLSRSGFDNIEIIDVTETSVQEQRSTDWMRFHSLKDFLNDTLDKTIEGYPPPKRATLIARKK